MTPEEHADNIARWTNAGLRKAVIDEIARAIAAEREACAKIAADDQVVDVDSNIGDMMIRETWTCRAIAAAIRARVA